MQMSKSVSETNGKQLPVTHNLRDVAEFAGVSLSTASRVFSNASYVSEEVRHRVLEAGTVLGYQPRERARKTDKTTLRKAVLFIRTHNRFRLSSMLGDFYGYVLQGIEAECRRRRLTLIFAHDDGEAELADQFDGLDIDEETGVFLVGPFTTNDVADVQQRHLPVVLINNVVERPVDTLLPDYYGGAQMAVRHLIAAGHHRIAYLHGANRYTTELRLDAYKATLEEHHIPVDPALITQSSMSPQSAKEAVVDLLDRGEDFTALFCVNDISALGAIMALREAGLRPGYDISLVGFDNVDVTDMTDVPLTTIAVPKIEMGALAVKRLIERAISPNEPSQRIILSVTLHERESVRQLHKTKESHTR
ncbi:MAG: hypothetical protein GFH27_549291n104 [Chloroflexi bacterium AL-W]|nr:hypothetical protein [Chloroflexi bacterium AL-N1]NOK67429.1 hypothetical protein [Chloroflexi bacterium AL-N10]NOK75079.1 hypothetical protein [Chloroflexi bacterium AL-N5]NOK81866.1 hypothetical protein [Chloroflexi bacterium AL-W]NOK89712.1 hypothetical protein [Chloroflexi bacterium AL-N15]